MRFVTSGKVVKQHTLHFNLGNVMYGFDVGSKSFLQNLDIEDTYVKQLSSVFP
jgi:hypothetical protein